MSQYYVYAYLDPFEPGQYTTTHLSFLYKPFYVGKGKGNRIFSHLKEARPTRNSPSSHKLNKIKSILHTGAHPIIIKIWDNLSEDDAIMIEEQLIQELKALYGLTNIRTTTWKKGESNTKKKRDTPYYSSRKDSITIYNKLLNEHLIIHKTQLPLLNEIYGESNIINTSEIKIRRGTTTNKARNGDTNGMHGKSAVRGKKWCIVHGEEKFLSPEEIDNLLKLNYIVTYGRTYKPKGKRIIFENELKGKYRTVADIDANPNKKYQFGLIWSSTKPTFINHTQI